MAEGEESSGKLSAKGRQSQEDAFNQKLQINGNPRGSQSYVQKQAAVSTVQLRDCIRIATIDNFQVGYLLSSYTLPTRSSQ